MGEVYEAMDLSLNRKVALKIISPEFSSDKEITSRFEQEGRTLAKAQHKNLVMIYACGREGDVTYLAMEFVEGESIAQHLEKKTFPLREAIPLFIEMLDGMQYLHQSGIVHRDLKPQNIIIANHGNVKIVDFGIAKDFEANSDLTRAGVFIGSVHYAAPEIAAGQVCSSATDMFSLGVIFYEMLVGKRPFRGKSVIEVLDKVKNKPIVFPPHAAAEIPLSLQKLIMSMCEKVPAQRTKDILGLQRELHRILDHDLSPSQNRTHTHAVVAPPTPAEPAATPTPANHTMVDNDWMIPIESRSSGTTSRFKANPIPYVVGAVLIIVVFLAILQGKNEFPQAPETPQPVVELSPSELQKIDSATQLTRNPPVTEETDPLTDFPIAKPKVPTVAVKPKVKPEETEPPIEDLRETQWEPEADPGFEAVPEPVREPAREHPPKQKPTASAPPTQVKRPDKKSSRTTDPSGSITLKRESRTTKILRVPQPPIEEEPAPIQELRRPISKAEKALSKKRTVAAVETTPSAPPPEPATRLATPELKSPRNGTIVLSQGKPVPIVFMWKKVAKAKYYEIQFSADPHFDSPFYSTRVNSSRFMYNGTFPEPSIYWRVRAGSPDEQSEWTEPSLLQKSE